MSKEGVKPNLNKVAAVIDFPCPETIHDVMRFTGLTNWFHHLIRDYGKIAQPLTDLTRDMKKEAEAEELARESKHGKKPRKGNFKRFLRETHLGMKWTQGSIFQTKGHDHQQTSLANTSIQWSTIQSNNRWMQERIWQDG